MRNLKKILALVLALMMVLSVMVFASAANYDDYSDKDQISEEYAEAVEVLTGMDIFWGSENSFYPKSNVTRAEVATLLYRVMTTDVSGSQVGIYADYGMFDDVLETNWFAGYVNYSANNEYVVGVGDNNYNPKGNVTGYEWITMLLRAIGYDANGEISGSDWKITAAGLAKKAGILEGFNEATLNSALTREQVAYLLFNAIQASQVYYTPALNYYIDDLPSIGWENFRLAQSGTEEVDYWGRPGYFWYRENATGATPETAAYNGTEAVYATIEQTPVYTTRVKVDECDIADAIGFSTNQDIESAWIDGDSLPVTDRNVTTDQNGMLNPLATTSVVGGQGRLTEVYNMGAAGYRLVEINTWLAQVTKVTEATTDKNGHTTPASITMDVYVASDSSADKAQAQSMTYQTTGYTVGEYVLVTMTVDGTDVVRSVETAPVRVGGEIEGYTNASGTTPSTTTVGTADPYNDADKFFLNWRGNNTVNRWDVIVDTYGNAIGLIPSTTSYLVIEKIEWEDGRFDESYAVADIVLTDGTKISGVTIASVDGVDITNTEANGSRNPAVPTVSDHYENNGGTSGYYGHVFAYTVDSDGEYDITSATQCTVSTRSNTFTTGYTSTIDGHTNTVVANDDTVFLVLNSDGYTYTVYDGVDELPSMTVAAGDLCYRSNGTYATLVLIRTYTLQGNQFVAYVAADDGWVSYANGVYTYAVYKVGSTEPTLVTSTSATEFAANQDGFYTFTVTNSNRISSKNWIMGTYDTNVAGTGTDTLPGYGYTWDRAYVGATSGSSWTLNALGGGTYTDIRVDGSTTYFQVTKTTYTDGTNSTVVTTIEPATASSVSNGDRVVVASKGTSPNKMASYVYILDSVTTNLSGAPTTPNTAVIHYVLNVQDSVNGDIKTYYADRTLTAGDGLLGTSQTYGYSTAVDYVEAEYGLTFGSVANYGVASYTRIINAGDSVTLVFNVRV